MYHRVSVYCAAEYKNISHKNTEYIVHCNEIFAIYIVYRYQHVMADHFLHKALLTTATMVYNARDFEHLLAI
jgi:hypothetical protein